MINIKIESTVKGEAIKMKRRFHAALKGSPAYINNEIAICDGDNDDEFYLVVGNDNENDVYLTIDSLDFTLGKK